jgi:pimeloyl-ACP methyl ester carboxylesterase
MRSHKCHPNSLPTLLTPALERGTQFSEFEGARLAFDFEPPNDNANSPLLLVLINGFQRSRLDFRALRRKLHAANPRLATLVLDNRGIGETSFSDTTHHAIAPEDRVSRMARDAVYLAESFAAALGVSRYATLGISMGGMIALEAASSGANISHLILVSTSAGGELRHHTSEDLTDPNLRRQHRSWPNDEPGMRRYASRFFGERFLNASPVLFNAMVKGMLLHGARAESRDHAAWQSEAVSHFTAVEALPHIDTPTLILCGAVDRITPPENSEALAGALRNARLKLYPEMGHLLLLENPEELQRDIETFLFQ